MAIFVDSTNLLSESWRNIYELIKDKSNVSDPISGSAQNRKWVYSREPDVKANDFFGFPYIIVHPVTIDFGSDQTGNRQIQTISWSVEIEVVSTDVGMNNDGGNGQSHNDSISDDILKTLNNETNRKTLSANGMKFFKPNVTSTVVEEFNNTLVYRRSFLIAFKSKKKVF